MKISIIGYYGANFGDLLMLNVLLRSFEKKYDIINIFTYGDVEILAKVLQHNTNFKKYQLVSLVKPNAGAEFRKHVKGSSSINWGGGTCFMDEGGTGGIKYMLLAKILGVKVNYIGIGVDKHSKQSTKMYIRVANLISSKMLFRDEESKAVADQYSLFAKKNLLMPDLAYHYEKKIEQEQPVAGHVLFCMRNLKGYTNTGGENINEELVDFTLQVCKELGLKKVVNLICDYEIDLEDSHISRDIFIKNGIVVEEVFGYELQSTIEKIANATFVVSVRLHPAVLANCLDVPYAILNYSDKNLKFVAEVNELPRLIKMNGIKGYEANFNKPNSSHVLAKSQQIGHLLAGL